MCPSGGETGTKCTLEGTQDNSPGLQGSSRREPSAVKQFGKDAYFIIFLIIFRYSSGRLHLCGCKGHQFNRPFYFLMNTLWGELWLYISVVRMQRPFSRGGARLSTVFNINEVLASGEESTNWLFNFWTSPELCPCSRCPVSQEPGAIPAEVFRASLVLHLLSRDGINKSIDSPPDWTLVSTSLLFFLRSIHENTYLLEHARALCEAWATVL